MKNLSNAVKRTVGFTPTKTETSLAIRLLEHLVVPTFVLNAEGKVMIWNRACERLTGLPALEVVGTNEHWRGFYETPRPCLADLLLKKSRENIDTLYTRHADGGSVHEGISAENWCAMPRIGSTRYLALDAGVIFGEAGELVAVVETARDITLQKQAQLRLETIASSDGLTGLPNRRMFDRHLSQEFKRALREIRPVSLLMIDVDNVKAYNDTLGHQAGDECLKQVSALIAGQTLRPGYLAARYGGEEFAVILPSTDLNGAIVVADRIMTAIGSAHLSHPASPISETVTLSIGVSCSEKSDSPDELISFADEALYNAKRTGRNRVSAQ